MKRESFYFKKNITLIRNPGEQDTILNLTLTAPEFEEFQPEDFERWFQVKFGSCDGEPPSWQLGGDPQ